MEFHKSIESWRVVVISAAMLVCSAPLGPRFRVTTTCSAKRKKTLQMSPLALLSSLRRQWREREREMNQWMSVVYTKKSLQTSLSFFGTDLEDFSGIYLKVTTNIYVIFEGSLEDLLSDPLDFVVSFYPGWDGLFVVIFFWPGHGGKS